MTVSHEAGKDTATQAGALSVKNVGKRKECFYKPRRRMLRGFFNRLQGGGAGVRPAL